MLPLYTTLFKEILTTVFFFPNKWLIEVIKQNYSYDVILNYSQQF